MFELYSVLVVYECFSITLISNPVKKNFNLQWEYVINSLNMKAKSVPAFCIQFVKILSVITSFCKGKYTFGHQTTAHVQFWPSSPKPDIFGHQTIKTGQLFKGDFAYICIFLNKNMVKSLKIHNKFILNKNTKQVPIFVLKIQSIYWYSIQNSLDLTCSCCYCFIARGHNRYLFKLSFCALLYVDCMMYAHLPY